HWLSPSSLLLCCGYDLQIHSFPPRRSSDLFGLDRGYCLMLGGEAEVVRRLDPIFATLAPGAGSLARTPGRDRRGGTAEHGYLHQIGRAHVLTPVTWATPMPAVAVKKKAAGV